MANPQLNPLIVTSPQQHLHQILIFLVHSHQIGKGLIFYQKLEEATNHPLTKPAPDCPSTA
jgi:hypothetical protein